MGNGTKIFDVMVIGTGFAGMAAALFAARSGLSVALAGSTGGIDFSTGFIDLMAVHPVEKGRRWKYPWAAIEALVQDVPEHPYAFMEPDEIRVALDSFTGFLSANNLDYEGHGDRNVGMITSVGTVKRTYRVPRTAWNGALALESKAPTLIVDFQGLKGFSGRQIIETLGGSWPGLKTARVPFPGSGGELFPEHMAWTLAAPERREELARSLAGHAAEVDYVGFPAVLGLNDPLKVVNHLQELTGKKIFEIPTLPPSIAGTRLRAVFDRGLPPLGVAMHSQKLVLDSKCLEDGTFLLTVGNESSSVPVKARAAILASGRFFGKGLGATRKHVFEKVFQLPVVQPWSRKSWHREDFFHPQGHPLNIAGIEVDSFFRPLGEDGIPAYRNLFAAGAILAHQDWMRMKCGAGLAIATAFKAVESLKKTD